MLNEGTYKSTLRLTIFIMETIVKNKPKIHNVDFIKILMMINFSMRTLLVTMLFHNIHSEYHFMNDENGVIF